MHTDNLVWHDVERYDLSDRATLVCRNAVTAGPPPDHY